MPAGSPRASPTISMTAQMPITINPSRRPNSPRRCCIGVLDPTAVSSMPATRPSSVRIPVATTMPRPRPWTAVVPLNAILMRSPMESASDFSTPACLSTGTDSPVRAASAIFRCATHVSRKSAGMMLPASMMTISPGTTSVASMCCRLPSRSTAAFDAASLRKSMIAFWARNSWVRAIAALRITIAGDHRRVREIADNAGDDRSGDEHESLREVLELAGDHRPQAAPARLPKRIGAESGQAFGGFAGGQSGGCVGLEPAAGGFSRLVVPSHRRIRWANVHDHG